MSIEVKTLSYGYERKYQFTVTRKVVDMAIQAYRNGCRSEYVCLVIDILHTM